MTATATPIRECDQALDYLYSMLEGEDRTRFEAHLSTCPRCQAELASFGQVRTVAQQTFTTVEPSERLTGALHAQLMHAAAQRKPRGKVIPFLRRVVSHPSYAAAAALVLVGGAVGLQWSRGRLLMPTASESAPAPVATPVAQAPAPAQPPAPGAATLTLGDKNADAPAEVAPVVAATPTVEPAKPAKDEKTKLEYSVSTDKAFKKVAPSGDAKSEAGDGDLSDRRAITAQLRNREKDVTPSGGRGGELDQVLGGVKGKAGYGLSTGSAASGRVAGAPSNGTESADGHFASPSRRPAQDPPKVVAKDAPPPPPREAPAPATVARPEPTSPPATKSPSMGKRAAGGDAFDDGLVEAKPQAQRDRDEATVSRSRQTNTARIAKQEEEQARAPQAQAPSHASPQKPSPSRSLEDESGAAPAEPMPAVANANAKNDAEPEARREAKAAESNQPRGDDIDNERTRAATLAQSGRCEEATSIYGKLDKKFPDRLNAQDRITYERCLTALGRLDRAQDQLNQLKSANRAQQGTLPAPVLNAEQKNLDMQRKHVATEAAPPRAPAAERRANSSPKAKKAASKPAAADAYESAPADSGSNAVKKVVTY